MHFFTPLLFLLLFQPAIIFSQTNNQDNNNLIDCFQIIDTIKATDYKIKIRAIWLNDTIYISRLAYPIKVNPDILRKLKNNKDYIVSPKEEEELKEYIHAAAQNCYCYALEKYCKHNNLNTKAAFNSDTHITQQSIGVILNNTFQLSHTHKTINNSILRKKIENNVIIAFRNNMGNVVHLMYYLNGTIYSKNGAVFPTTYKKLSKIYKVYKSTSTSIEFYTWNKQKIAAYYNKNN